MKEGRRTQEDEKGKIGKERRERRQGKRKR
jgi:hypothetical protein